MIHAMSGKGKTVTAYLIISFITGINYMIVIGSLFIYFKDVIKTEHYIVYYALAFGGFAVSSSLSEIIIGRIVDRTRKAKLCIFFALICGVWGGLIYAIYSSPIFPVIGRILAGVQTSFPTIANGELIRIYDGEAGVKAQYWLATSFSLGIVVGPALNIIFKNVDVSIGNISLNPSNAVGLFTAILGLFALVLTMCLVTDSNYEQSIMSPLNAHQKISDHRKPVPEKNTMEEKADNDEGNPMLQMDTMNDGADDAFQPGAKDFDQKSENIDSMPSFTEILKAFSKSPLFWLMMISTLHFTGGAYTFEILISIINYEFFHWSLESLTIIYTVSMVLYAVYLLLLSQFCLTGKKVYGVTLVCIVLNIVSYVTVYLTKFHAIFYWQKITLMCIFVPTYPTFWVIDEASLRIMTAKMVPTHLVCQAEACRRVMHKISYILASVLLPIIVEYIVYWTWTMATITLAMLLVYMYHWKSLCCIQQIRVK